MNPSILVIDKPIGFTSHDVVNIVRRKTGERRVGHAGTLDPLATGILIVLVGKEATKRQAEFMGLPKEYETAITCGETSATDDAEGPLTPKATLQQLMDLKKEDVLRVLPQFMGTIQQRPPIYSAIKKDGQPLYKKARRGEIAATDVAPRSVTIDDIELIRFIPATPPFPPLIRLRISCQKGVYIRSLARDIGEALGVGAYMSELKRTAVGPYTLPKAMTLDTFEKQWNSEKK
ncbi:MAG: tRNA pseudouridine(55) synthase TruB [Candidatus Kerfeldbacteria bacterium]|nr:tRNA pseudouridine(55) synthase TruB [Candidatus Kerfeldbacteria bacterium]